MKKRVLAILAYVLPTFPLGFLWHLSIFAEYYASLDVYREDLIFPFGLLSMVIQGLIFAILYERLFAGEPILRGAFRFAALACPLAWTFMVLAVAAKHHMASVSGYVLAETGFVILHYLVVSPLIAAVYAGGRGKAD